MKKTYAAAGLGIIALVLIFAVISFLRENWAADGPPGGIEKWLARTFLLQSRSASEDIANPFPATDATLSEGRVIYDKHCAFCHGPDGQGPAASGMQFYPPVPSLQAPPAPLTDGQVFSIVQLGIRYTAMPGFGKMLSEEEIWKAGSFVQSLATRRSAKPSSQE